MTFCSPAVVATCFQRHTLVILFTLFTAGEMATCTLYPI